MAERKPTRERTSKGAPAPPPLPAPPAPAAAGASRGPLVALLAVVALGAGYLALSGSSGGAPTAPAAPSSSSVPATAFSAQRNYGSAPKATPEQLVAAETACKAGDGEACLLHAQAVEFGVGTAKNELGSIELYRKACEAKSAHACARVAEALFRGDFGGARDTVKSEAMAKEACASGSGYGCAMAALVAPANTPEQVADPMKSAQQFQAACKLGSDLGCVSAARMQLGGRTPGDPREAEATILRLCDEGSGYACRLSATLTSQKDPTRADEFRAKACSAGDVVSCADR